MVERLAYDAWGKRRFANGADDPGETIASLTDRGFTGHEHLEEVGLIHMNGRVYDPVIARFMSADPLIDDAFNTQSLNRYTYVINNPLAYTDPSGYLKLGRLLKRVVKTVVAYVVGTVVCGSYCGAAVAGAYSGYSQTHSLKGALIGAVSGLASAGIGTQFPIYNPSNELILGNIIPNAALHAARACATAAAMGGHCGPAAAAGGVSAALGPITDRFASWSVGDAGPVVQLAGQIAGRAVVGGIAAKAAGGNFEQGATEGAFEAVTNALHFAIVAAIHVGRYAIVRIAASRTAYVAAEGVLAEFAGPGAAIGGSTIAANRLRGLAAEGTVAEELTEAGYKIIGSHVTAVTSAGRRVIDHLVLTPEGQLLCVEVKCGSGVGTALQKIKDSLMATEGATLRGKNAPTDLRDTTRQIPTIVISVP